MGVGKGGGSMSTTTDVIYTHKKFKRAATESWEGKETRKPVEEKKTETQLPEAKFFPSNLQKHSDFKNDKINLDHDNIINGHYNEKLDVFAQGKRLKCEHCGFTFENQGTYDDHHCIKSYAVRCQSCKEVFQSNHEFSRHECILNLTYKETTERGRGQIQKNILDDDISPPISENSLKLAYNRSYSFPGHNYYKHEGSCIDKVSTSPVSAGKQIYKPKFRAQYSFQENPPNQPNVLHSSNSSSLSNNIEPSSLCSNEFITYHSTTASLLKPGSSQQNTNQGRSNTAIDSLNTRNEEYSISKGFASQCSNIWKGIKSPSPELVGQHITNLIVQNQAIVETHNPLWSMKYRRHSSSASSQVDADGGASLKPRKVNDKINDNIRTPKTQQSSIYPSSSLDGSTGIQGDSIVTSLSSLPRSYSSYSQSFSAVRASKNISNPSLTTSSHQKIKPNSYNYNIHPVHSVPCEYVSISSINKSVVPVNETALESLDLSKSSKCGGEALVICNKCGTLLRSGELDHHSRLCFHQIYNHEKQSDNNKPEEQEVALDLKKKRDRSCLDDEISRMSTISEPLPKPLQLGETTVISVSPKSLQSSPPLKKKKISSDTYNYEKSSYAYIFPQNGRMSSKVDYGMKFFDDFGKPKVNSHHLYGGEVQICDGKEMKTLKIDSSKSETPSLDLCIASKHLGVDLDSNEAKVPTSVVVTIAKCGLNSGGTMVKIENKSSNSYTTRKIGLNVQNVHGSASLPQPPPHQEQIINLGPQSTRGMTSPVIHSPLIHYQKSEPSENITNLSLKLLKGVESTVSALSNTQSPQSSSVYKTINSHNLLKVNNNNNNNNNNISPSLSKEQESDNIYKLKPYYPSVISIGDEVVPYVPGIPGPYSQANIILKTPKARDSPISPVINAASVSPLKFSKSSSHSPTFSECSVSSITTNTSSSSSCSSRVQSVEYQLSKEYALGSLCPPKPSVKSHSVAHGVVRIPEIRVNSASFDSVGPSKSIIEEKIMKSNFESEHKEILNDGNTFLVPRKRPNTLILKPQTYSLKSSISLIGSTLVSPDTPRPKKSCAQLFLNGSAYTYLNLKVSTKTFFCCIYRPQPMYVLQSTDPKLSMYSNWQIRKTEDPLNISPSEAMSLHVSGLYYNKAYTIAKPKYLELIITDSSYWTQKDRKSYKVTKENIKDDGTYFVKKDISVNSEAKLEFKNSQPKEAANKTDPEPKRIKICEGGFKTNEDYTYVRGRGRGRYVCETCGIRCKKPSMLKKHIRTHTDLRPFACQHCSFSFKTKGNLTKHLKSKAHFKRCTEMGIIPVPITANDSHVSAGHIEVTINMQGLSEQTKDQAQNMYDDDDEEEEEEEEDDDDDDDDDEDEDYDEDDEEEPSYTSHREEPKHCKMSDSFMSHDNRNFVSSALYHPSISCEEKSSHMSSSYPHSDFARDSVPYPELDLSTSKPDRNDDTTPIDLSIKRPSVITACNYQDTTSERDQTLRPNHLPIPQKIVAEISKSPTAPTTPIKENMNDILSPVTESSLLLKSIYDTTYRVSSSNLEKISQADPMKDTSCGPMLQTYLTERAVLDSTRKRYQYLHTSVEDQSLSNDQNFSIVYSSHQYSGSSSGTKSYTSGASYQYSGSSSGTKSCTSSASYHSPSQSLTVSSTSGNACLIPITSNNYETGLCYPIVSSSTSVSSSDKLINISHTTATSQSSVSQASKSFSTASASQKSEPPMVSSSSIATAITTSSKTSDARINRAGRKIGKAGSGNSFFNTSNPMPTSPANLTVINNCSGDTKTAAFIAPSGVMPSSHNNKLGSDDGKCKCNVCHKEFAKQGQLRLHINIHYIERPHRCESCGISFRTNGHLQKHKRSVSHFNKVNMNMTFGTPSTDNPRPFKCHDCKIAFRIYGHLAKHLRSKLHIMKLECLGKLPFGTYAEIERSGGNLNEIDTSDCENSLESLQLMASKLYEKEPAKLLAWQSQQQQAQQQKLGTERERTISNSSNNSEEYSLLDDQECGTPSSASTGKSNGEESGDEDDPPEVRTSDAPSASPSSSVSPNVPPCEIGSGATEGLIGCPKCHKKFLDLKTYEVHHFNEHEKLSSKELEDENIRSKCNESQGSPVTSGSPDIVGVEATSQGLILPKQGNSGTTIESHEEEDCQL